MAVPLPALTTGRLSRGDVGGNHRVARGRAWPRVPPRPGRFPRPTGVEARVVESEESDRSGSDPSAPRPLECARPRTPSQCAMMTGVCDQSHRRAHASRRARPGNPGVRRCRVVAGPRPGATVVSVAPGVPTETGRVGHVAVHQDKVMAVALPRQGPRPGPRGGVDICCRAATVSRGTLPPGHPARGKKGSRAPPGAEVSKPRQARCRGTRTSRPGQRCRGHLHRIRLGEGPTGTDAGCGQGGMGFVHLLRHRASHRDRQSSGGTRSRQNRSDGTGLTSRPAMGARSRPCPA